MKKNRKIGSRIASAAASLTPGIPVSRSGSLEIQDSLSSDPGRITDEGQRQVAVLLKHGRSTSDVGLVRAPDGETECEPPVTHELHELAVARWNAAALMRA